MNISTILDNVVSQITSYVPTRDPQARFHYVNEPQRNRDFNIASNIIDIIPENPGELNIITLSLNFFYKQTRQDLDYIKDMWSDAQELQSLLHYALNNEWLDKCSVFVKSMDSREEYLTIVLEIHFLKTS